MAKSKKILYAEKRLNLLKGEMGSIKKIMLDDGKILLEFENGMNLQLHEKEIEYQAVEHLNSEIETVRFG